MGNDSSNSGDSGSNDSAANLEITRLVSLASALDQFSHGDATNNFRPEADFDSNASGPGKVESTGYAPTIMNTRATSPNQTT